MSKKKLSQSGHNSLTDLTQVMSNIKIQTKKSVNTDYANHWRGKASRAKLRTNLSHQLKYGRRE